MKLTEAEFATFQTNQANIGAVSSTTSSSSASGGDGMSCAKDASEFWTFLSRAYKNICNTRIAEVGVAFQQCTFFFSIFQKTFLEKNFEKNFFSPFLL